MGARVEGELDGCEEARQASGIPADGMLAAGSVAVRHAAHIAADYTLLQIGGSRFHGTRSPQESESVRPRPADQNARSSAG